ncbi:hypothetical protein G9A89_009891 [Geosiphon pyriformis]|nr:hypothetical protein G9A89_009891 [Geosiphon pyriformis]
MRFSSGTYFSIAAAPFTYKNGPWKTATELENSISINLHSADQLCHFLIFNLDIAPPTINYFEYAHKPKF